MSACRRCVRPACGHVSFGERATEKIPFDVVLAPEEACGEAIHLSGTLLAQFRTTESSGGNLAVGFHFNPQGITGVGLTSGATYHATGVTQGTTTIKAKGGISERS